MRTFTLQEANRLLPQVELRLAEAQQVLDRLRHVRDQLTDLRIIWGDQIEQTTCPDHPEYAGFRDQFVALEAELRSALERVSELGCEVKDPDVGLVDFYAQRRDGIVYLCWRRGEDRIRFWHGLQDGFGGRKPISEF